MKGHSRQLVYSLEPFLYGHSRKPLYTVTLYGLYILLHRSTTVTRYSHCVRSLCSLVPFLYNHSVGHSMRSLYAVTLSLYGHSIRSLWQVALYG